MYTEYTKRQPSPKAVSGGVSYTTLVVSLCAVIIVTAGAFWGRNSFQSTENDSLQSSGTVLTVGSMIQASGMLTADGDMVDYTHRLHTSEYGTLGIRSSTISLQGYDGEVVIQGEVVEIRDDMYIVDISSIYPADNAEQTGTQNMLGTYVPKANIYLLPGYDAVATLQDSSTQGEVGFIDATTQKDFSIGYFVCSSSNASKNCKELEKNFSQNNEKSLTNSAGDQFFKQSMVDSRFATNGVYGYFIKDATETTVEQLTNYLVLPSQASVQERIVPYISDLCRDDMHYMTTVSETKIIAKGNDIMVLFEGTPEGSGSADCEVKVDFSHAQGGEIVSFEAKVSDEAMVQTGEEEQQMTPPPVLQQDGTLEVPADVDQFPINLEKSKTFSSRRGHNVTFPSSNISYGEQNMSSGLGLNGVRCFAQMNVIAYKNKDMLDSSPALRIYQCTIKDGSELPAGFRRVTASEDKDFLIEVADPSWTNFANNVQITVGTGENQ